MTGWEVIARGWGQDKVNDRYDPSFVAVLPKILDRMVNQLGINRIQLHIWSGTENPIDYHGQFLQGKIGYEAAKLHRYEKINDNNDPLKADLKHFQFSHLDWQIENVALPMRKLLAARGEKLYVNFTYADFKFASKPGTFSHAQNPAEYAEIIAVSFQHMKEKYGIVPDALDIVLEPDNTADWKGGKQVGRCLVAALERLKVDGFPRSAVIAPSCANTKHSLTYFDEMIRVPHVLQWLTTLSYHRYGGDSSSNLRAIGQRAQWYHLQTGMSERLEGNIDMLMQDLTLASASYWQQWAIAEKNRDRGYFYFNVDMTDPKDPKIHLTSRSRLLQQCFRYVRLGAVRIGARSNDPQRFAPVAFADPAGKITVIVRNKSSRPFRVDGFPAGTYSITYSGPTKNNTSHAEVTITSGEAITTSGDNSGALTIFPTVLNPPAKEHSGDEPSSPKRRGQ